MNVKRFWTWVGILLLVELAAITLCKRWYWFFPTRDVSEVYTKYAGTDGLNVVFLKDFKINDSVFVDVTLIEALDSAAWELIERDFRIIPPEEEDFHTLETTVSLWLAPHNNYSSPMDTVNYDNDVIVMSYFKRTIAVFDVDSRNQIGAIFEYNITKTKIKKK